MVQNLVEEADVSPEYVPGSHSMTDLLTKPLAKNKFEELCKALYSGETVEKRECKVEAVVSR